MQAVLLCLALRARSAVLRHHLPEQPGSPADLAPFRVIRRAGLRADAHGCPEPSKFSQLPARGAAPAQQSGRGTRRGAGPRSCGHTQAGKAEKEKRSGGGSAERGGAARDLLNRDLPVGIFGCHRFICWAALGNSRHAADPSGRGQPAEPSRAELREKRRAPPAWRTRHSAGGQNALRKPAAQTPQFPSAVAARPSLPPARIRRRDGPKRARRGPPRLRPALRSRAAAVARCRGKGRRLPPRPHLPLLPRSSRPPKEGQRSPPRSAPRPPSGPAAAQHGRPAGQRRARQRQARALGPYP